MNNQELQKANELISKYDMSSNCYLEITNYVKSLQEVIDFIKKMCLKKRVSNTVRKQIKEFKKL